MEQVKPEELLRTKRNDILEAAGKHGARNVRVCESCVHGNTDKPGEIDFIVEMEPGRNFGDLAALWRDLNELLGIDVDVVTDKILGERNRERVFREAVPA